MENSYRALMIAAGVFLGVLLLSSFVYVFRAGARMNKAVDEKKSEQQAALENSKFEFYNRGDSLTNTSDEQNTITDMVSLINLVYANNKDGYEQNRIHLVINLPNGYRLELPKDVTGLKRNQVNYSMQSEPISVYDLLQKRNDKDFTGGDGMLSDTRLDNNSANTKTNYKYIFPVKNFTYYENGKVEEMVFNCKKLF